MFCSCTAGGHTGDSPVRGNVAKRQKGCRCAKNAPTIFTIKFIFIDTLS